jgi:hypothetical protein
MAYSALILENFEGRITSMLNDSSAGNYDALLMDEALLQVLGDLTRATGVQVEIEDLNSATSTTVDLRDEDLVIRGACAYCLRTEAASRSQAANVGQSMPANLLDLAKNWMYYYEGAVKTVRVRKLQESANNKPGLWEWDESEKKW